MTLSIQSPPVKKVFKIIAFKLSHGNGQFSQECSVVMHQLLANRHFILTGSIKKVDFFLILSLRFTIIITSTVNDWNTVKKQDRSSVKLKMAMRKLYSIGFTFFILSLPSIGFNANECGRICGTNNDTYAIHIKTVTVKYILSKKCCCGPHESSCDFKRDASINEYDFILSDVKLKVYPPANTGILLIDISPGFHAIKRGPPLQRVAKVPVIPLYIQNLSLIF